MRRLAPAVLLPLLVDAGTAEACDPEELLPGQVQALEACLLGQTALGTPGMGDVNLLGKQDVDLSDDAGDIRLGVVWHRNVAGPEYIRRLNIQDDETRWTYPVGGSFVEGRFLEDSHVWRYPMFPEESSAHRGVEGFQDVLARAVGACLELESEQERQRQRDLEEMGPAMIVSKDAPAGTKLSLPEENWMGKVVHVPFIDED